MRGWRVVGLFCMMVAAVVGTTGCGPSVSREELGEVVFEVPKVAPKEEQTPAANPPPAEAEKSPTPDKGED
jgi:hypothetical protein